jgi:hypothetical protein
LAASSSQELDEARGILRAHGCSVVDHALDGFAPKVLISPPVVHPVETVASGTRGFEESL